MLMMPWENESVKSAVEVHGATYGILDQVLQDLAEGCAISKLGRNKQSVTWVKGTVKNTRGRQYYSKLLSERGEDAFCVLPPGRLHKICRTMKCWETVTPVPKKAKKVLKELYDYERFGKGMRPSYDTSSRVLKWEMNPDGWGAWKYIKELDVHSCAYCNADTIFALEITQGKKRVEKRSALDHFYGHAQYPFVGLTLSNLVPTCTRCNSNVKGARELEYGKHIYPYEDSFHKGATFAAAYAPGKDVTRLGVDDVAIGILANQNTDLGRKAARSAKFFCLHEVYNQLHREDALAVVQRELMHSESYRNFLKSKYPGIMNQVLDRVQNGMSIVPNDILKHNLAKMTYDIVCQFRGQQEP